MKDDKLEKLVRSVIEQPRSDTSALKTGYV